jgi:hypothetical protein
VSCSHFLFTMINIKLQIGDNSIEILKNEMWRNGRSNAHMKLELI